MAEHLTYRVVFTRHHLDGPLAGLKSEGQSVSFGSIWDAGRALQFYRKVESDRDFLRCPVTGNRATVSNVQILPAA